MSDASDIEQRENPSPSIGEKASIALNLTRQQLSDTKARRRIYSQKPVIIEMEDTQADKSTLASVKEQFDTLNAIKDYNKSLKPARRAKDSLPEITTTNIGIRDRWQKDYKKGDFKNERTYHMIGNMDHGLMTPYSIDKYDINARQRAIQRTSSQQKIDRIRTSHANLLGLTPTAKTQSDIALIPPNKPIKTFVDGFTRVREQEVPNNPFTPDRVDSQISLSVYNRPKTMASVRREIDFSKTADDLLRKIPGWKPPVTAPVDGEAAVEVEHQGGEERQSIIPEFNMTQKFEYVTKNATDTTR